MEMDFYDCAFLGQEQEKTCIARASGDTNLNDDDSSEPCITIYNRILTEPMTSSAEMHLQSINTDLRTEQCENERHCKPAGGFEQTSIYTAKQTNQIDHTPRHSTNLQSAKLQKHLTHCSSRRKISFLHQLQHFAISTLLVLALTIPAHTHSTSPIDQSLSKSPSSPMKDVFYSPETWIIEELEADETSTQKPPLQITDTLAHAGYLFRATILVDPQGLEGRNEQDTSVQFQATEAGKKVLPFWLHLNVLTGELSGLPLQKDQGKIYLIVNARIMNSDGNTNHFSEVISIEVAVPSRYPMDISSAYKSMKDCTPKSTFPSHCLPNETPLLANFIFIRDFRYLKPLHRATLLLAVSDLVGVCSNQIWLNRINWSSKESLKLWSQLASVDFKSVLTHATILSFVVDCQPVDTIQNLDISSTATLMDNVLSICGNGIALDDDGYAIVDCYKWVINKEATVLDQSQNIEIETSHNRVKRQEEDGTDYDNEGGMIDASLTTGIPSTSEIETYTHADIPTTSSSNTSIAGILRASSSSSADNPTPSSVIISDISTTSSLSTADISTQFTTMMQTSVAVLPSVPLVRVVPSSEIATFMSGQIFPTAGSPTASLSKAAIMSSEFIEAFTTVAPFLMSSAFDFESVTTVMQMIVTPTTRRTFSFSINPSIEILDSTNALSSFISPTPTMTVSSIRSTSESVSPSISLSESQSLTSTVQSTIPSSSLFLSSSFPRVSTMMTSSLFLRSTTITVPSSSLFLSSSFPRVSTMLTSSLSLQSSSIDISTPQSTVLASTSIRVTSSPLSAAVSTTTMPPPTPTPTSTPTPTPTLTPTPIPPTVPSLAPSSSVDFSSSIEDTSFVFFPQTTTMVIEPVESTNVMFTIGSSGIITPTRTAVLMPMPTSELSVSISMFTPSAVETSISIPLTVFTLAPSISTETISPSETLSEIFMPPTTTMVPMVTPTPLTSRISLSSMIPTPSSSRLSTTDFFDISTTDFFDISTTDFFDISTTDFFDISTSDFFDISTTSIPMFFMSTSTIQLFTETPLVITPSFSFPVSSSLATSTSVVSSSIIASSLVTSDFPMTSDILFPTTTNEFVLPTSSIVFVPTTTDILFPETSSMDILFPETTSTDFFPEPTTTFASLEITPTPSFTISSSTPSTPSFSFSRFVTPSLQLTTTFVTTSLAPTPLITISPSSAPFTSTATSTSILMDTFTLLPSQSTQSLPTTTLDNTETIIFPIMTTDILMPFSSTPMFSSSILPSSTSIMLSISPTPTPIALPCEFVDCGNGTCINLRQDFLCECFNGWTGQLCDIDIDYCSLELSSSGFSGALTLEPCDIQGTSECIDGNSTYTCVCLPGFTGRNCSVDIDNCVSEPCLNNGTCVNEPAGDFNCECSSEYTGPFCEIDQTPCSPNPCSINEICTDLGSGIFECINITTSTPLISSTSVPILTPIASSSIAQTSSIQTTSIVSSSIALTSSLQNSVGSSSITPILTSIASSSESILMSTRSLASSVLITPTPTPSPNVSICEFVNCGNGTCIDLGINFRCECFAGWTGELCDIDIDYCSDRPCDINGTMTCLDGISTYTCFCILGYTGRNCSIDIDECAAEPCFNNATCVNGLFGEFVCICPDGFTGRLCDINVNPCSSNPCKEGEICIIKEDGRFACMFDVTPSPTATLMSTLESIPTTTIAATSSVVTSSFVTMSSTPLPTPTPSPENTPPVSLNQIGTLLVNEGQAFQFTVPENTFFDQESGMTSQLQLILLDSNGNSLPNTTWIQLRYLSGSVLVIEGLPLNDQVTSGLLTDHVFLLRAGDGHGGIAHDLVTVRIIPAQSINNFLMVYFEGDFELFNQTLSTKIDLYNALTSFGPAGNSDVYIRSFSSGSIAVSFTNLSIANDNCFAFLNWAQEVITISDDQNTYTDRLILTVLPFVPTNEPQIDGPCRNFVATPGTDTPQTPALNRIPVTDRIVLLATVIPATILACLCLCCGIIACILYRRRRSEREQLFNPPMKRAFLHRRPVVLAGELDLPPRGRRPVILINEQALREQRRQLLLEEAVEDEEDSDSDGEDMPAMPLPRSRLLLQPEVLPPPYVDPPVYHYARHRFNY